MSYNSQQNKQYNNGYQGGGGRSGNQSLPEGYLARGYYEDTEKKVMRPEYIIKYPKEIVEELKRDKNKNKSSQLRKYYGVIVQIKDRLRKTNASYDEMKSEILHLINLTEYALIKGNVTPYFKEFISKNIHIIRDEKDFMAFAKHFEAIIANLPKEN